MILMLPVLEMRMFSILRSARGVVSMGEAALRNWDEPR